MKHWFITFSGYWFFKNFFFSKKKSGLHLFSIRICVTLKQHIQNYTGKKWIFQIVIFGTFFATVLSPEWRFCTKYLAKFFWSKFSCREHFKCYFYLKILKMLWIIKQIWIKKLELTNQIINMEIDKYFKE